jgi:hypothetical protein
MLDKKEYQCIPTRRNNLRRRVTSSSARRRKRTRGFDKGEKVVSGRLITHPRPLNSAFSPCIRMFQLAVAGWKLICSSDVRFGGVFVEFD